MTFLDRSSIMVSMNTLTKEKRIRVLGALVEGNSIRATVRMTGAAKNTVVRLLRGAEWADMFMYDLSQRLRNRVQLTSDGHKG